MRTHLLSLCILLVAVDCGLNPQPLPPDAPSDGGLTIATPGVGNDSGARLGNDAGKQTGGGEPDAGTGGLADGSAEPPWGDGGEATPDGGHNAEDAALDGWIDAGLPDGSASDGSASDGPHGDAAGPVDAATADAAGDGAF